jgi:hypothetical protein
MAGEFCSTGSFSSLSKSIPASFYLRVGRLVKLCKSTASSAALLLSRTPEIFAALLASVLLDSSDRITAKMATFSYIYVTLMLVLLAKADNQNAFTYPGPWNSNNVYSANPVFEVGTQVQFLWTTTWPMANLVLQQINTTYEILQSKYPRAVIPTGRPVESTVRESLFLHVGS